MPKLVDHDEYREDLLEQCYELFSRRGYKNVTMRGIAKELGIASGKMYYYFPKKENIFEGLFDKMGKKCMAGIYASVNGLSTREEKVKRVIKLFSENQSEMHKQFLLTIDLIRENVDFSSAGEILDRWVRYYSDKLRLHLALNKNQTNILFTFLMGAIYSSHLYKDPVIVKKQLAAFEQMFLESIASE